eukprot:2657186-Heterocapsa_arctica.AAC.1
MLEAKQIQSHKREKTNKARQKHVVEEEQPEDRLGDKPMDKSDSEDTSCVQKNRKVFQNNIDQQMIEIDKWRRQRKRERRKELSRCSSFMNSMS